MIVINSETFLEISRQLEDHHALFYKMWQLGRPVADKSIPTAAVSFDSEGECMEFAFNPDFWDACSEYDRLFIICHESLHVILRHGVRTIGTTEPHRCNIALDLVVNHMLVNKFGFDRNKLSDWESLIWVDTVFSKKSKVPTDLSFEQYFQLIPPETMLNTLDDHGKWKDKDSEEWVQRVAREMSDDEKDALKEMVNNHSAGTEPGNLWWFADRSRVKPKKKWETVIKKWAKQYDRPDLRDVEQWARVNRRYSCLESEFILPTEMETEHDIEGRIGVWFFQDTSGSCYSYANRFFKAAKSLPEDRFEVKLHCFDTLVYETTIESGKLYGGGGTSFDILEKYIQRYIKKENVKYPQAVFVITDGFGTNVNPEKPDRWHWFLTSTYVRCIPDECKIFNLKDFE